MQKEVVEIKSKQLKEAKKVEYEFPETLEEGLKLDGKEKVFKLYSMQRKIRYMDSRRRAMTGTGITSNLAKAVKKADPANLAQIAKLLGDPDLLAALEGKV